ncbi:MAG: hypothetical protein QCI38_06140 [Candidatus Thermoplasmatota archaeon]|nr:hypothetical protein [Candidatus Thermoplasmatota archaeon]
MNINAEFENSVYAGRIDRDLLTNVLSHGLAAPSSVVLCLGGGTNGAAQEVMKAKLPNTQVVAVNCDEGALKKASADKKLLVGRTVTYGKDAGGFPEVGERCFEMSEEEIRESMYGSDVVYLVACLGGGFATGFAPRAAKAAKEDGRVVVSILFTPFSFEDRNDGIVQDSIESIRCYSDSTVVNSNDDLMFKPNMKVARAFSFMDRAVVETIKHTTQRMDRQLLLSILEEEMPRIMAKMGEPPQLLSAEKVEEEAEEEELEETQEALAAA